MIARWLLLHSSKRTKSNKGITNLYRNVLQEEIK
jgi:hypothetical protein